MNLILFFFILFWKADKYPWPIMQSWTVELSQCVHRNDEITTLLNMIAQH